MFDSLTDVQGISVGHFTDLDHGTGCTVILCPPEGAVAGVDVRGPAPATRETDLLRPGHLVERVNAILLTGGSAFGLDAAAGVMRYLEERNIGFDTPIAHVPIVPAAAIFDLALGSARVRPNAESAHRACLDAHSGKVEEGNVGAGTGATVGHLLGMELATKGGLGTASLALEGVSVGVLVAVNAFGDVLSPDTGEIVAGTRNLQGGWLNSADAMLGKAEPPVSFGSRQNTTLAVVATSAALTKEQVNLVAAMAHDGLARAVSPAHTLYDGDVIFALSTGKEKGNVSVIGHAAAVLVARAIVKAVKAAQSLHGIPARRDWLARNTSA